jgi:hypothetical protein
MFSIGSYDSEVLILSIDHLPAPQSRFEDQCQYCEGVSWAQNSL